MASALAGAIEARGCWRASLIGELATRGSFGHKNFGAKSPVSSSRLESTWRNHGCVGPSFNQVNGNIEQEASELESIKVARLAKSPQGGWRARASARPSHLSG